MRSPLFWPLTLQAPTFVATRSRDSLSLDRRRSAFAVLRSSPPPVIFDRAQRRFSSSASAPPTSFAALSLGTSVAASAVSAAALREPEGNSNYGRRDYWDDRYREAAANLPRRRRLKGDSGEEAPTSSRNGVEKNGDDCHSNSSDPISRHGVFSWYAGWNDIEPFFAELVPDRGARVLVPGIGNDAAMVDMYDSGYRRLSAFDYAPEGVACALSMFGPDRLMAMDEHGFGTAGRGEAEIVVADARELPYPDGVFDATLEKGTLDAVFLSGGTDKDRAKLHLSMAVSELARVVRKGGVVVSITAACVDAVQGAFAEGEGTMWKQLRDGSLHITDNGYASNSVDATILAWERL